MVNDDHDDRMNTSISAVCGVTSKDKKYKVHCVEVLELVYEFFENIDDFNFVEEFDKIVEYCTEVAVNEIDKVQEKGIYNDVGNVDDLVIIEAMIEKEFHNDNIQNVVCSVVDRATEIRNDVLNEQLKFLEEWLENPKYDHKYDSLVVEAEMKKVDYLVVATEADLNEEIVTAFKEEQNEKNQYGSQYDLIYIMLTKCLNMHARNQ